MTNTLNHRVNPSLMTGLTATGSSQATAFPLTNNTLHEFTTVASSTGAILPIGVTPSEVTIYNNGASTLTLYPPKGGSIDAGTANASVSLAAGSGVTFWASTPSNWYYLVTPGESGGGSVTLTGAVVGSGTGTIATSIGTIPDLILPSAGPTRFISGPFINVTGPGNAVQNTTAFTSLFTGAALRSGQSLAIPANSLLAGDEIEISLTGTFGCNGNPSLTIRVLLGGTTIMQGDTGGQFASTTNGQWILGVVPTKIWFPQVGASGGATGFGELFTVNNGAGNNLSACNLYSGTQVGSGSLISVNTTGALALDVQVQWSAADPLNTIQLLGGTIKKSG
jgi:hypothetical protein